MHQTRKGNVWHFGMMCHVGVDAGSGLVHIMTVTPANEHFSKVEHVFRIIKCQFGYKKVVYCGLKKNENCLFALFACADLYSLVIAS